MTDPGEHNLHARLEAYLDGQLEAGDREAFESLLRVDQDLALQAHLQSEIDAGLNRMFAPSPNTPQRLRELLVADPVYAQREVRTNRRRWQAALLALAASLLLVVSAWQFLPDGPAAPFFQPRSLVQIYHETVDAGFEPYYECRDPNRFADTFARRQDQPLLLVAMPADRRMLGLSYPGGFTRDTTAMLCRVKDQPVVVFVDRTAADLPEFAATGDSSLHVHRAEKLGLVFYEIGPFDSPQMIEYFVAP